MWRVGILAIVMISPIVVADESRSPSKAPEVEAATSSRSPASETSRSSALLRRAETDPHLRSELQKDWKAVFRREGLPLPKGELVIVEQPLEGMVVILPPLGPASMHSQANNSVGLGGDLASPAGEGAARLRAARPTDRPAEPREPPEPRPVPKDTVTTLRKLHFKRWNQNPFGPGCKNDAMLSFTIPSGATLQSITIGENDCGPSGEDVPTGKYIDSHVALGITAGAVVLNYRPTSGRGPGPASVGYHWWFNQWGHVSFAMCINVKHNRKVTVETEEFYDHLNMDDGLKAYRIKTPICLTKLGVTVSGNTDGSNVKVRPDVAVAGCENGALWWFGCKNDKGEVINF